MIEFKSFHAVTLQIGQSIEIGDWNFNQPDEGVGTLDAEMRPHPRYRDAFVPDKHGVAVVDDGVVVWAGFLRSRPWKRRATSIQTMSEDLGSFFYDRVRGPGLGDYLKVNTQQVTLWNDLITNALTGAPASGVPAFGRVVPAADGVLRQLTFRGLKTYGAAFDNLARRDRGLQWWVDTGISDDGRFVLPRINVGRRGKRGPADAIRADAIRAESNRAGGKIIDYDIPDSSEIARTAVYATGDGQPPDVPWSYDEDPTLGDGLTLRREIVQNYSGVTLKPTLTKHAEDERRYRSDRTSEISIVLPADAPDYRTYDTGDRARVEIEDGWVSLFLPAAAITDREVKGSRGEVRQVKLTLDTSDYDAPSEEVGVEV